jgi:thioesterase domain-containing protein
LAAALPSDQPVYAIDPRWTAGLSETRVEEMAARYLLDLRTLQPKGPYHLGGYCFGGYVAYEMARQLHIAGETTALLLLIDSAAPNGEYERIKWWRPGFLPRFLGNAFYSGHDLWRIKPAERRDLMKRKWTVLKRSLTRRLRRLPSGIDVEEFIDTSQFPEDELKLWQVHLCAGDEYVPKPYPGRVTLLRTRRQPFLCSFDPQYGWGDLAEQGVDIRLIPGSHENIFVEPDVTTLAAQVNSCLEIARQTDPVATTAQKPL